jgi:hypothetical protein
MVMIVGDAVERKLAQHSVAIMYMFIQRLKSGSSQDVYQVFRL